MKNSHQVINKNLFIVCLLSLMRGKKLVGGKIFIFLFFGVFIFFWKFEEKKKEKTISIELQDESSPDFYLLNRIKRNSSGKTQQKKNRVSGKFFLCRKSFLSVKQKQHKNFLLNKTENFAQQKKQKFQ